MSSVFSMVKRVITDSKEKIASQNAAQPGSEKRASAELPSGGHPSAESTHDPEKVAKALDYVADNIHLVVDQRSPQEKLAEYEAISEAMAKAASKGDEPQGPHQSKKAPEGYQSPTSPGMTGEQMGAGGNQMKSEGNSRNADGVLEAGQSGQATSEKINPKTVTPGQSAFPGDEAGSALETTQEESDRPGGQEKAPMKIAQARAVKLAQLVAEGKVKQKVAAALIARDRMKIAEMSAAMQNNAQAVSAAQNPAQPGAETATGASLSSVAKQAGVPEHMAAALIGKFAADAENPAKISAGKKPELQTAKGANPAQSQGHEAGEKTPDTKGSDQGREALQSIRAAINATKGQLKTQRTRSEMGQYLDEPAFSKAHDKVLQQSLENASSAGVKIAATEMLQKWASNSPDRMEKLQSAIAKVKAGNAGMPPGMPPGAAGAVPPEAAGGEMLPLPPGEPGEAGPTSVIPPGEGEPPAEGAEPVSDAALAAAAQGVSPEDLEMANAMLEEQMGAAAAAGGEEAAAMDPAQAGVPGGPEAMGAPPAEPPPPPAA